MSNEIISAYDAFVTRFRAAQATGQALELCAVKDDVIMNEMVSGDTLPSVRLFPTNIGRSEDSALNSRGDIEMTVLIRLREDPQYRLYNSDKSRGLLWLLQRVANVIDGADRIAAGAWQTPPQWTIKDYEINETTLRYDLEVRVTTARFTRGQL
jgi:hypothetical protein